MAGQGGESQTSMTSATAAAANHGLLVVAAAAASGSASTSGTIDDSIHSSTNGDNNTNLRKHALPDNHIHQNQNHVAQQQIVSDAVILFRLQHGLCHGCGTRIYQMVDEMVENRDEHGERLKQQNDHVIGMAGQGSSSASGMSRPCWNGPKRQKLVPLTVPGVVTEGRCLFCYPSHVMATPAPPAPPMIVAPQQRQQPQHPALAPVKVASSHDVAAIRTEPISRRKSSSPKRLSVETGSLAGTSRTTSSFDGRQKKQQRQAVHPTREKRTFHLATGIRPKNPPPSAVLVVASSELAVGGGSVPSHSQAQRMEIENHETPDSIRPACQDPEDTKIPSKMAVEPAQGGSKEKSQPLDSKPHFKQESSETSMLTSSRAVAPGSQSLPSLGFELPAPLDRSPHDFDDVETDDDDDHKFANDTDSHSTHGDEDEMSTITPLGRDVAHDSSDDIDEDDANDAGNRKHHHQEEENNGNEHHVFIDDDSHHDFDYLDDLDEDTPKADRSSTAWSRSLHPPARMPVSDSKPTAVTSVPSVQQLKGSRGRDKSYGRGRKGSGRPDANVMAVAAAAAATAAVASVQAHVKHHEKQQKQRQKQQQQQQRQSHSYDGDSVSSSDRKIENDSKRHGRSATTGRITRPRRSRHESPPNGSITLRDKHGTTYTGIILDGTTSKGRGRFTQDPQSNDHDGKSSRSKAVISIYEGEYANGMFEGQGWQRDVAGCIYEGSFKRGASHGFGKCIWPCGWVYEGEWKDDLRDGKGTCRQSKPGGEVYSGQWKNDKWHGRGELTFSGGDVYRGEFKDAKMHGKGEYLFSDGSVYKGEFKNDGREGYGEMDYSDGVKYRGSWKNNWRDGTGRLFHTDGSIFEGHFRQDEMGDGLLRMQDGILLPVKNGQVQNSNR